MSRWLSVLVALAGCRSILGIDDPRLLDASAPADSMQRDAAPPPDSTFSTDAGFTCPSSYLPSGLGGYYRPLGAQRTWSQAEAACEADTAMKNTHLVVLSDATEAMAVRQIAQNTNLWVGLSDLRTAGTWIWVTNEAPSYLPWATNYPQNDAVAQCAMLNGSAQLQNNSCNNNKPAICECDGSPANPANF